MLLLNNQDVERLLTMPSCIAAIEDAYKELGSGRAAVFPEGGRVDVQAASPGKESERSYVWGAMAGALPTRGVFALRMKSDIKYTQENPGGLKTWEKFCRAPGTFCGLVMLFSTQTAEPLAIINDGIIQHIRVAATAAVAAKYLARQDSQVLGVIGSGGMARSHCAAFCAVRPIKRIRVFSSTPEHRQRFAKEMSSKLGVEVTAVDSPEAAVKGVDIVSCCTDSFQPVLEGAWVQAGMHLACVLPWELTHEAVEKADVKIRHLKGGTIGVKADEARIRESTQRDLRAQYRLEWQGLPTLADLVSGNVPGRTSNKQITYYHNVPGSGIQFAAVGAKLLELAKAQGVGREIPSEWFLQDIRD